jgi:hypothetical protein
LNANGDLEDGGTGGTGVTSVTASGSGITASPTTGAVVITNTGVTSNVAGTGIGVSSGTGASTISLTTPSYNGLISTAVSFQGTTGSIYSGTAVNVSSVTRSTTGSYTVNFSSPLANTPYNANLTASSISGVPSICNITSESTSSLILNCFNVAAALVDPVIVTMTINGH